MASVELQNVTKSYGRVKALDGVTITCPDQCFLFILGPSGAGKTSILRSIAGLEEIDDGEIHIGASPVSQLEPRFRDVALAFENYALYPHLSVFDNVAFPLRSPGRKKQYSRAQTKERVEHIAGMLQIDELLERRPNELSGGQKQRVALARSLVRQPQVFLLDEPIAHLDAKLRYLMRAELKRMQKDFGTTAIYATPDQAEALSMADLIAVLNHGVVQQIGTPEDVYDRPANRFVAGFLGDPPMSIMEGSLTAADGNTYFALDGVQLPLEGGLLRRAKSAPSPNVLLGVRPADTRFASSPHPDAPISGEVYLAEIVGRETHVTVKIGEQTVKIRADAALRPDIGEIVYVGFDLGQAHLFDAESGVAIP